MLQRTAPGVRIPSLFPLRMGKIISRSCLPAIFVILLNYSQYEALVFLHRYWLLCHDKTLKGREADELHYQILAETSDRSATMFGGGELLTF